MLIDWLVLSAALLSGLLGGVHCAAMCGAIATSLSFGQKAASPATQWLQALQPNLVGGFGHGLVAVAQRPEVTIALRVGVGLLMIVVALRLLDPRGRFNPLSTPANALWRRLQPLQHALLPADTLPKRIGIGLLWGWLPCGLSTTLLFAAWLEADALHGGLLMASFGLGTLPVMLPLTWSGARLGRWIARRGVRVAAAVVLLLAGLATATAPWLATLPAVHAVLEALGCRSLVA
jgi:sulfite exporter TauE/SafE